MEHRAVRDVSDLLPWFGKAAVDARPADLQQPCNLARSDALAAKSHHLCVINASGPATIPALGLGAFNALTLPLRAKIGFELGDSPEDRERQLSRRGRRVHFCLMEAAEAHAFVGKTRHQVVQIAYGASPPVEASYRDGVAIPRKVDHFLKGLATLGFQTGALLAEDALTSRRLQRVRLNLQALACGRNPRVSNEQSGLSFLGGRVHRYVPDTFFRQGKRNRLETTYRLPHMFTLRDAALAAAPI